MSVSELFIKLFPTICQGLRIFTRKKVNHGTVLIVEDDPPDAMILEHALRRLGYECEIASTGELAQGFIQRTFYTYIFVDLRLPGLSGSALLRLLSNESPNTKLIIVCGEPSDLRDMPDSTPMIVIKKPPTFKGLVELFRLVNGNKL